VAFDVGKRKVSTKTKVILTCLPFLVIGVIALFLPKIRDWQAAQILERLETMPLTSIVSESSSEITSTRRTFSIGSYGVTDVGNLRLAFEDLSFSGSSSGVVTLATDSTSKGGGGHTGVTGVGKRRFEERSIPRGMQCKFGGVTFEFIDGKLNFGGKIIDATGSPTLVLVGANREILEVKPIRTPED